jgi:fatty-acid peroxygenase
MKRSNLKSEASDHVAGHAAAVPSDGHLIDATVALLREGYEFIPNRCEALNSDIFLTRLMLRKVICMRGPEAATLFYGSDNLTRVDSMPQTVLRLLRDKGSVQQLDCDAHRHRKAMFVRMLTSDAEGVKNLVALFQKCWKERCEHWEKSTSVGLASEAATVLAQAAFKWSGVPADHVDLQRDGKILAEMIEGAGHFGPRTWAELFRRSQLEGKLTKIFTLVRNGTITIPSGTPIDAIARHLDLHGELLSPETAAVELINVLRPIVAIGRYIVFAAMALQQNQEWCRMFKAGHDELLEDFVEEVRRISPFFPFVGAVAKTNFLFRGHEISEGQWLLLDLYGTIHDAALFPQPDRLKPVRQLSWRDQNFTFIPQGGGDTAATHRCPGELVTVEIIKEAMRLLCRTMTYDVADQDMTVSLRKIPAGPASGFRLSNVRLRR